MRVVLGEDEALLRAGLKLVMTQIGFDVVGEAGDAEELVRTVATLSPDLVVTDIRMPPTNADEGIRAALRIKAARPDIGIVVLSQHVQRRYALELLEGGTEGIGYLLKQRFSDIVSFGANLRRVASGGTVLDPEVVALLLNRSSREHRGVDRLTDRQREVLGLMAEGLSNAAIATRLSVTERAVVQHASNIYTELDLPMSGAEHRRVLAVISWLGA